VINDYSHLAKAFAKGQALRDQINSNPPNSIKTTKYNVFSFLPITFFLQFAKVVQTFYLINGILQAIPSF